MNLKLLLISYRKEYFIEKKTKAPDQVCKNFFFDFWDNKTKAQLTRLTFCP